MSKLNHNFFLLPTCSSPVFSPLLGTQANSHPFWSLTSHVPSFIKFFWLHFQIISQIWPLITTSASTFCSLFVTCTTVVASYLKTQLPPFASTIYSSHIPKVRSCQTSAGNSLMLSHLTGTKMQSPYSDLEDLEDLVWSGSTYADLISFYSPPCWWC